MADEEYMEKKKKKVNKQRNTKKRLEWMADNEYMERKNNKRRNGKKRLEKMTEEEWGR